ncbi:MAG: hypothetical protein IKO49_03300 [Bacilli bacterium]|nr:hypothetical protein [Bacilli bacterium]
MEDIVISSYRQQIKESALKAQAVKEAGFDIVIEELEKRGVKTSQIKDFFNQIVESHTMEDLNRLTLNTLIDIISDINQQVTRSLIAKVEIADALIRKSRLVALSKSPNGRVSDDDNYVKVGSNLASQINKDGIAMGLDLCIRNYCNQKIYQANYREKIVEKQKELGIYDEDAQIINKSIINQKISSTPNTNVDPKTRLLRQIFNKDVTVNDDLSFEEALEKYRNSVNERMKLLKSRRG